MKVRKIGFSDLRDILKKMYVKEGNDKDFAEKKAAHIWGLIVEVSTKGVLHDAEMVFPECVAYISESNFTKDGFFWVSKDKYIPIDKSIINPAERW